MKKFIFITILFISGCSNGMDKDSSALDKLTQAQLDLLKDIANRPLSCIPYILTIYYDLQHLWKQGLLIDTNKEGACYILAINPIYKAALSQTSFPEKSLLFP